MRTKSIVLPIVVTLVTVVIAPSVPAQSTGVPETPLGAVRGPYTVKELFNLERSIQSAIEEVEPAIVAIGNRFGRKNTAQLSLEGSRFASGVIISEDGLVLSQYHVSHEGVVDEEIGLCVYGEPGETVEVILADGRRLEGKLLGGDRLADISLLQLNVPGTYAYATLASVDRPTLGQWAIKLGHPAGYQPSRGVSARLGRVIYANDLNLVASCRTNGGDSGGPMIDVNAKILGLIQTSLMPFELSQLAVSVHHGHIDFAPTWA